MATGDPTTAYRKQQGMAPITQSYDPKLVAMIVKAAKQTGADPVALLATAIQESGARLNGPLGDQASGYASHGPFQMRETVGALGNRSDAWANSYAAVLNRAQEFKKGGVHHGKGAAAVQRPQDKVLYARGVDSHAGQAAAILQKFGMGSGIAATLPLPDGTASSVATPAAPTLLPMVSVGPGSTSGGGGLGGGSGGLTAGSFMEAALQTLGVKRHSSLGAQEARTSQEAQVAKTLPLPDGSQSTVPNPTMMDVKKPKAANNTIVDAASKFLGTPYLWGGTTAKGLDCSGLVQLAVKSATGKVVPRVAQDQYDSSTKVPLNKMQPGDVIGFGTAHNVHHIGIYMGNGKMIDAPHTGAKVRVESIAGRKDIVGAGRF